MDAIVEIACSELAIATINEYASQRKLNPLQVAIRIPGIVHEHAPTTHIVEGCGYCQRNGNVFGSDTKSTEEPSDIISKYKQRMKILAEEMKTELLEELSSKIST